MEHSDTQYPDYFTPAYIAVYHGNVAALEDMIRKGLDVNEVPSPVLVEKAPSLLHIASRFGQQNAVIALRRAGADVNAQDGYGDTPLMIAMNERRGRASVPILLLNINGQRADPNIPNNRGYTPLFIAVRERLRPYVKMLLDSGARSDIETINGETAKLIATDYGIINMLK